MSVERFRKTMERALDPKRARRLLQETCADSSFEILDVLQVQVVKHWPDRRLTLRYSVQCGPRGAYPKGGPLGEVGSGDAHPGGGSLGEVGSCDAHRGRGFPGQVGSNTAHPGCADPAKLNSGGAHPGSARASCKVAGLGSLPTILEDNTSESCAQRPAAGDNVDALRSRLTVACDELNTFSPQPEASSGHLGGLGSLPTILEDNTSEFCPERPVAGENLLALRPQFKTLYGKLYRSRRGKRVHSVLSFLHAANHGGFCLPEPWGYNERRRFLLLDSLEGDNLGDHLDSPAGEEHMRHVGEALAAFHCLPERKEWLSGGAVDHRLTAGPHGSLFIDNLTPVHDARAEVCVLRKALDRVKASSLPPAVQREFEHTHDVVCAQLLERGHSAVGPRAMRLLHRDFYPGQIMVGDGTMGLVDLDEVSFGEPELDAGNFVAHLFLHDLERNGVVERCRLLAGNFIRSYLSSAPLSRNRLAVYTAASLLRLISLERTRRVGAGSGAGNITGRSLRAIATNANGAGPLGRCTTAARSANRPDATPISDGSFPVCRLSVRSRLADPDSPRDAHGLSLALLEEAKTLVASRSASLARRDASKVSL